VAGLHPELARELALGEGIRFTTLFEDLSESFFFHNFDSTRRIHLIFCRVIHRGNTIRENTVQSVL